MSVHDILGILEKSRSKKDFYERLSDSEIKLLQKIIKQCLAKKISLNQKTLKKQEKHSKSADLRHLGQILILKYDAASKEMSWFVILV